MIDFASRIAECVTRFHSPLVVGLDPRLANLPPILSTAVRSNADAAIAFEQFCREVIDVVKAHVGIVKPQVAFFEQLGPPGLTALANVITYARW